MLLGGRAAEQLVFKELSTGAQNDLQRATAMARQMITLYGMSDVLGPTTFESSPAPLFLPEGASQRRGDYSERTAQAIDEEVRGLLLAAAERVRKTLSAHRTELQALAQELLIREVVDRQKLTSLIRAAADAPSAAQIHSQIA